MLLRGIHISSTLLLTPWLPSHLRIPISIPLIPFLFRILSHHSFFINSSHFSSKSSKNFHALIYCDSFRISMENVVIDNEASCSHYRNKKERGRIKNRLNCNQNQVMAISYACICTAQSDIAHFAFEIDVNVNWKQIWQDWATGLWNNANEYTIRGRITSIQSSVCMFLTQSEVGENACWSEVRSVEYCDEGKGGKCRQPIASNKLMRFGCAAPNEYASFALHYCIRLIHTRIY